MRHEFSNGLAWQAFTEENQSVQARFLDTPDEALGRTRSDWASAGKAQGLNAGRSERLSKGLTEQWIPIVEKMALADEEAIDGISALAAVLDHPRAVGLGCDPGNVRRSTNRWTRAMKRAGVAWLTNAHEDKSQTEHHYPPGAAQGGRDSNTYNGRVFRSLVAGHHPRVIGLRTVAGSSGRSQSLPTIITDGCWHQVPRWGHTGTSSPLGPEGWATCTAPTTRG